MPDDVGDRVVSGELHCGDCRGSSMHGGRTIMPVSTMRAENATGPPPAGCGRDNDVDEGERDAVEQVVLAPRA